MVKRRTEAPGSRFYGGRCWRSESLTLTLKPKRNVPANNRGEDPRLPPVHPRGTEWTRPTQSCTSACTAKSMLSPLGLSVVLEVSLDYSSGESRYADLRVLFIIIYTHTGQTRPPYVLWMGPRWKAIVGSWFVNRLQGVSVWLKWKSYRWSVGENTVSSVQFWW